MTNPATLVLPGAFPSQASAYRQIARGYVRWDAQAANTGYALFEGSGSTFGTSSSGKGFFYLDPADYALPNLATFFRLRHIILTNDTAPTSTFGASLYPISGNPGGGAAAVNVSAGAAVTGSTPTAIAAPALDTATKADSADFTIATAGFYSLGGTITTNMVASSSVVQRVALYVHNV